MPLGDKAPDARPFTGTIGRLTVLNIAVSLLGLMSGIVQARALGPTGRGELAAIIVPLYVVAFLGDIGLGLYARREAARTTAVGSLIGTIGLIVGAAGIVLAAALLPLVDLVSRGRPLVHLWLSVGLLLLPLNLLGNLLLNVTLGLERWALWIRTRLLAAAGWLVVLALSYALGRLTISTAAVSYFVVTLGSYVPLLSVVRHARPIRFERSLAKTAIPFGSRSWLAGLTNLANTRLDQFLMAGVVSSRELGLYAVAVAFAAFPSNFSGAVALGILPRVVRDGEEIIRRAVRVSLLVVVVVATFIAAAAWPFVHIVIGSRFESSLPMMWVLLVAEIPLAGTITLGQAFIGSGRPGRTAAAEALALVLTIVGLALVLQTLGGFGAAVVSLLAYSVSFGYLLVQARRTWGHSPTAHLLPTRTDAAWAASEFRRILGRRRTELRP